MRERRCYYLARSLYPRGGKVDKSAKVVVFPRNKVGQYPRGLTSTKEPNIKSSQDSYANVAFKLADLNLHVDEKGSYGSGIN
ncbi:hypothetical protein [Maribacter sp. ACAM166]|uniref:hypothetical protein n=1 Tax=Maribacter sp. ACAM166 TaxID=2508996 RepID=UPI0010FD9E9E|nr:hypothetical protein [Maribacter sp. ACAM166]TLP79301.1 hypothetical protein ES765_11120 [Maribacter sp. ACAM166]